MEDKRTWDCVKSPSKQLLCTTLLLRTIFCSALGSSRRPPTSPSNVVAKKSPHFHPFCSKSNFVWGGRGGVASFSNITGKVPTLLTSIVEGQKKKINKTTTLHVHHPFFLLTWKFLISCACSMDLVNTVFLFSYFQIRYFPIQPQRISLTFNKMKVSKINEVWNSVNSLFKTFLVMFGLLSSKILLPRQHEVTSFLY